MLSHIEKLRRFYECFSPTDNILVPIVADPDSIGSALAIKRLLWRRVSTVTIANINIIKRPDNLTMIKLLNIKLVPLDNVEMAKYKRFVLVDAQPSHHPGYSGLKFDVIIDHHPVTDVEAAFKDVRPNYGANSTIMTEYLKAAKIKPSVRLATGLFYGIKNDTKNFERQVLPEDIKAFQYLFKHININILRKIESAEITKDFLRYYQIALSSLKIRKNRIFVHLGSVINPDICVIIADFFMKVYTIDWTFVSGIYNDQLIIIIRNDGIRKDAGGFARKIFGKLGSAGGHKSSARAEIPLENLNQLDYNNSKRLKKWIIRRVFNVSKVSKT